MNQLRLPERRERRRARPGSRAMIGHAPAEARQPALAARLLDLTLRFLITGFVIAVVGGAGMIAWDHLQRQIADLPRPEQMAARTGGPLSLETIEDYVIELYLRIQEPALLRPASSSSTRVRFRVAPGETASQIADRLQQAGLISDANLFRLYVRREGIGQSLEAGEFELSPNMNIPAIVAALQEARIQDVMVTIPEGLRAEEVSEILQQFDITNGDAFLAIVRSGDLASIGLDGYALLADRPPGASLEGYLFPDTYRFPLRAEPREVLRLFLDNLDLKFTPALRQEAASRGLSLYQVLTLASIVEREAVRADERPLIASVYLNRLAQGMLLNADPTVQYAMGFQPDTGRWWKTPVTLEEYNSVISPYNTYLNPGLPPGPICSPGLSAIEAVIRPAQTDYLYFVATGDGGHVFASSAEEHQANVARYQGSQ